MTVDDLVRFVELEGRVGQGQGAQGCNDRM